MSVKIWDSPEGTPDSSVPDIDVAFPPPSTVFEEKWSLLY